MYSLFHTTDVRPLADVT